MAYHLVVELLLLTSQSINGSSLVAENRYLLKIFEEKLEAIGILCNVLIIAVCLEGFLLHRSTEALNSLLFVVA